MARRWSLAAVFVCGVAAVLPIFVQTSHLTSGVRYFSAVMLLTPFMAILGARRPGASAWPWFVVLPLVVVLQWPVISQLAAGNADLPITVPTPTAIGFLFVLIMGAGNYFGTLNTTPMLAIVIGILFVLSDVTEFTERSHPWTFPVGCWFFAAAGLLVSGRFFVARTTNETPQVQHLDLWQDFRDIYGIVWAKRVMDRVNQFAVRENWPVEMSLDGFQQRLENVEQHGTPESQPLADIVPDRAVHILCWILRRFVDRDFLRRYLPESSISVTAPEE